MRVTGQMITESTLYNINRNKTNLSVKADRKATGQQIQKPSDDPVIAVRTLKYRSQLVKIEQYKSNVKEALSWLEQSEGAMKGINELTTRIHTYCNQAVNDPLDLGDKNKILESLQEFKDEWFQFGNTDYAGRYVFTGYRTDTSLMFETPQNGVEAPGKSDWTTYTINENLKYTDITSKSYVVGGVEYDANSDANDYAQAAPSMEKANRLQLSYGKLDQVNSITLTDKNGNKIVINEGGSTHTDKDGAVINPTFPYKLVEKSLADHDIGDPTTNPYAVGDNEIAYIKETGELILGKNVMTTAVTYTNISAEYDKTEFDKGDIRPEHYFACTTKFYEKANGTPDGNGNMVYTPSETIHYTEPGVQNIEYELNVGQKVVINTLAKDTLSSTMTAKIDELIRVVNDYYAVEDKIAAANTTLLNATTDEEKRNINAYIEQLNTELTLRSTIITETFGSGMTVAKNAETVTGVAQSSLGSRYNRVELIGDRVDEQETTITDLLSDVFLVDLEDAVIEFESAQTYYNASLMAASKVLQNSLLDYIR